MKRIRALLLRKPGLERFIRYSAGSIVATLVSAITFAVAFDVVGIGSTASSVVSFATGALVAFVINRFWAWQRRDTPGMGGEFLRYWVVAIATALIATVCTTVADHYATHAGLTGLLKLVVVEGAYFGSYAVTFAAKFVLLDRFVFRSPSRTDLSRAQVENTTRA
jgi:putative flippase GtrA